MANIDDVLVHESGRILGEEIHQRTLHTSPFLDLIKKGTWPDEMGEQLSVMTYERSLPATDPTWTTVTFNDGTGNNCVPTAESISFAQTLRTFTLAQTALEGPPICVNDLRFTFKRRKQLENCFSVLSQNTSWLLQNRHRSEYCRLAQHQVIADASLTESTTMPASAATSRLTGGILKNIYLRLIREGAARDGGSFGMDNGRPQFVAIMSPEMDDLIVTEDYGVREDFRNVSGRAPELLQALGVDRPYRGFYHMIDDFPRRWNLTDGAWVEVAPYVSSAATYGNKWEVNPLYQTATHEDTIIFVPTVYTCLVPQPITTPGGNTSFEPQKYMGTWGWRNIQDQVTNPDKTWGYFRGVFQMASEPVSPQFGYVIRHLRADPLLRLVDADGADVE